jgi:hypothetical protein
MAKQNVVVWNGLNDKSLSVDDDQPLAALRNTLQSEKFMQSGDRFLYYNAMEEKETTLDDINLEARRKVSQVVTYDLLKKGKIHITDPTKARPDLVGIITPWFYNRHLGVQVALNEEPNAKKLNGNRPGPIMMTNVKSVNPNVPANFNQVIVCDEGSQVQFNINSWGAAGYGYRIRPDRGAAIADEAYICFDRGQFGKRVNTSLQVYCKGQQLIQIVSTGSQAIPGKDAIQYMRCTVQSWRVTSFKKSNGETFRSDAKADALAFAVDRPPDFGGPHYGGVIPGEAIRTGMPIPGQISPHPAEAVYDLTQDSPDNNQILGEVTFYFFVFKDRATADKVVSGVNAPDAIVWQ